MRIRPKLMLIFLLISSVPLVVLTVLNYNLLKKNLIKEASGSLHSSASQAAIALDQFLAVNIDSIRTDAQLPAFTDYLSALAGGAAGSYNLFPKAIEALNALSRRDSIFIRSYALLDLQGRNLVDSFPSAAIDDESTYPYFSAVRQNLRPQISPVLFLPGDDEPALFFSAPIFNPRHKPLGILRVRYRASIVQKILNDHVSGMAQGLLLAALIDEKGFVIGLHPHTACLYSRMSQAIMPECAVSLPDLRVQLSTIAERPFFSYTTGMNTAPILYHAAGARLSSMPWTVLFSKPADVLLKPVQEQLRSTIISAAVICLIAVLAGLIVAGILARPLSHLTGVSQQLASGHMDARAHIESRDEIGLLARSFNSMVDRLKATISELDSSQRELARKVDDLQRSELELRQSREHFSSLFEFAADSIMLFDQTGRILKANTRMCEISGYTPDELTAMNVTQLFDPEDLRHDPFQLELILQGQHVQRERTIANKSGQMVPVELHSKLMPDGSIQTFIRDISERRRSEQLRSNLEEQLRQSQKLEAMGTLAGGIAHDFNNILGAIIGYTELSMDAARELKIKDNLEQVLKAADRARTLVQQILAFSRKSGQELKPLRIAPIIKEAVKLLRASIPSTIKLRESINDQSLAVNADPTQIHQVLMNLCTNASQAIGESDGVIAVELYPVAITEENRSDFPKLPLGMYLRLNVIDTGPGINPSIIDRIYEPFFTTKAVGKGTGMGLAAVHGIVQRHGGAITVSTQPGKETRFSVLLPVIQAAAQEIVWDDQNLPRGTERLLFIDDEEQLVDVAKKMLLPLGYTIETERRSLEAFAAFVREPGAFDLVITDQTMPNMTGYEMAKRMIAIRPDMPIILCTGYSEYISEERAREAGIRAFLLKPLDRKVLAETIRNVLDKKI